MTRHIPGLAERAGETPPAFDARAFLKAFEEAGGRVYSDGRSFAIVYPSDADVIPLCLIEWGAVIEVAHERAIYGA